MLLLFIVQLSLLPFPFDLRTLRNLHGLPNVRQLRKFHGIFTDLRTNSNYGLFTEHSRTYGSYGNITEYSRIYECHGTVRGGCVRLPEWTGMGRITGMGYWNGPKHLPLSSFYVLYLDRVAKSSHRKRFDREIFSLGTQKNDTVWWGARGGNRRTYYCLG